MSVIEDVRQVLQDFIAPELKSLEARLTVLEGQVTDLRTEMRAGFGRMEALFVRLENQINLADKVERFNERLARVEQQQHQH